MQASVSSAAATPPSQPVAASPRAFDILYAVCAVEGVWLAGLTTFRLTVLQVVGYPLTAAPLNISCRCPLGFEEPSSGGKHCRDPRGVHRSDAVVFQGVVPLSCDASSSVSTSTNSASNWGLHPGPHLISVLANDPDNSDAVFSDGDTLTLVFDEPTDLAGIAVHVVLNRSQVRSGSSPSVCSPTTRYRSSF